MRASASRLVVAVFHDKAADFASSLQFPGAAAVVVVSPKSTYRRAREMYVDLFALALADFFVLANSTFSFWAQFFAQCRRTLPGWWAAPGPVARAHHTLDIAVSPYRQDKIAEEGMRSSTFELVHGPHIFSRGVPLFEHDLGAYGV